MIYTCKGVETKNMSEIDVDPFEYIWNYEPQVIKIHDYTQRELFKANQAPYFLAGELLNSKRGNDNLLYKQLISLDYEGLDMSLKEFVSKIHQKLNGLSFILYPTIHCFNKNDDKRFRYRLVIKLDREYIEEENKKLVKTVGNIIGIDYDPKCETYSQLMGLPILTPFTNPDMIIRKRGESLPVDKILALAEKLKEEEPKPNIEKQLVSNKKYTAILMEELIEGVSEGNRNNWLTRQIGRLLYLGMDHDVAYQWLWLINDNFIKPPLEDREINTIFKSILNKELQKVR